MRIIARRILREYVDRLAGDKGQPAVKAALNAWFDEVSKAHWTSSADVKRLYATASIVSAERIVFNIKGNDHRLVVAADFEKGVDLSGRFGTEAYAMEELVAELGAAFLCGDLGLVPEPRLDHAQYIKHWLTVLKSDKKAVFTAASKASEASNWLMSLAAKRHDIEDAA
jgi:antirestriction protein ArdC